MNGSFLNVVDLIQLKIVRLFFKQKNRILFYLMILVPPVQSILPNTSTTIDESAATSDVKLEDLINLTFPSIFFPV
jgi:hypothetical protein